MPLPGTEDQTRPGSSASNEGSYAVIVLEDLRRAGELNAWQVDVPAGPEDSWIAARPVGCSLPEQGWKLHVTSSVSLARETLERILPVLRTSKVAFKVAATRRHLADLHEGRSGASQTGKFVTVYPVCDAEAVRLATALDAATRGLYGPAVPSDRPLYRGSLVSYRYGGFGSLEMRNALGEVLPAIRSPMGSLAPDRRLPRYSQPDWVTDPFLAAGIASPPEPLIERGGRYLVLGPAGTSARCEISLAFDLQMLRRCVLKCAPAAGESAADLRRDWNALNRLAPERYFPEPFELFEDAGERCLAMEDIAGMTIERHLADLRARSALPPIETIIRWGCELADLLEVVHRRGLVYRDLKPTNVLVTDEGALRLIDFELAVDPSVDDDLPGVRGRGSRGYMSPQQSAGEPPSIADDLFGFGAMLFLIATGAEPSRAPKPESLLDRPVSVLNPAVGPAVAAVIGQCLEPALARFASASAVADALRDAAETDRHARTGERSRAQATSLTPVRVRALAHGTGVALCDAVERAGGFQGWRTGRKGDDAFRSPDLNVGAAGAVIALATLVEEFDDAGHHAVLREAAFWLASLAPRMDPVLPGLFVGEAGVAFALLRAAQALGDGSLLDAARERSAWVASCPYTMPDLFHGAAGRVHLHLQLWRASGDDVQLEHALAGGDYLLRAGEAVHGDGLCWRIPAGYESLSHVAWLGYAHGAAGIADVLLELACVAGDQRYLAAAASAARWLVSLQQPSLSDGSGLNWPSHKDAPAPMAFWCHGAAGVGRFLLRLGLHVPEMETLSLALRAGRTVAHGARWAGPTQCHGLAGNIEFLLDLSAVTGNADLLDDAWSLAQLLLAFASEHDGAVSWIMDSPEFNPGYTVGWSGVALCLLRLAAAGSASMPGAGLASARQIAHLLPVIPPR